MNKYLILKKVSALFYYNKKVSYFNVLLSNLLKNGKKIVYKAHKI
jgi:hypothetical protein